MQTNITREGSEGLIIPPEELSQIHRLLHENYGTVQIVATCNEGSEFATNQIDDILKYENPNFRCITSLELKAGENFDERCRLSIEDSLFSSYTIHITDKIDHRALKVANELEKRLRDRKCSYSILTGGLGLLVGVLITILPLVLAIFAFLDNFKLYLSAIIPIQLAFLILSFRGHKYWAWLFPKIWFNLGRQLDEFKKRENARNFIFYGVIATILIGIATNFIYDAIKNNR